MPSTIRRARGRARLGRFAEPPLVNFPLASLRYHVPQLCMLLLRREKTGCKVAILVLANVKRDLELRVRTSKYLVGMSVSLEIARPGTMSTLLALICHVGAHCQPSREGLKQAGRNSPSSKAWPMVVLRALRVELRRLALRMVHDAGRSSAWQLRSAGQGSK